MERREPTLSTGEVSDKHEPRVQPDFEPVAHDYDRPYGSNRSHEHDAAPRSTRPTAAPAVGYSEPPPSSLPAIALVIAITAVAAAAFVGWQLFQAQDLLKQADQRLKGLEQQLSLTSEESSASVVTLQSNLKKLDSEVRRIATLVEQNRKTLAANTEKITAVGREATNAQKGATEAKSGIASLKQEVAANKTVADAAAAKIDGMTTGASQQAQRLQDMKEALDKMSLELTALDSLASRMKNNEEAISAIDDFRRSTNRELLQIKQQLGGAPK